LSSIIPLPSRSAAWKQATTLGSVPGGNADGTSHGGLWSDHGKGDGGDGWQGGELGIESRLRFEWKFLFQKKRMEISAAEERREQAL